MHHRGHRHRRGDLLAIHRAPRPDERVPCARAERAERCAQVVELHVRVHRRDEQGLHLRRGPASRGCSHGQVNGGILWHFSPPNPSLE